MENITLGQVALALGTITVIWTFYTKVVKTINDSLDKKLSPIKRDVEMLSEVTYEMLDHMATNNNTGNMKKALDKYVQYSIKDE